MAKISSGKIDRIDIRESLVFVRTSDQVNRPREGYFYIPKSHSNYEGILNVAIAAAKESRPTYLYSKTEIDPNSHSELDYMIVEF